MKGPYEPATDELDKLVDSYFKSKSKSGRTPTLVEKLTIGTTAENFVKRIGKGMAYTTAPQRIWDFRVKPFLKTTTKAPFLYSKAKRGIRATAGTLPYVAAASLGLYGANKLIKKIRSKKEGSAYTEENIFKGASLAKRLELKVKGEN